MPDRGDRYLCTRQVRISAVSNVWSRIRSKRALTKRYGHGMMVDHVGFQPGPGEILGV
jgi:hypothetical protein